MKKISLSNYKVDKIYPRVVRAVEALLARGQVVAPVDVFVQLDLLSAAALEDWRFGRVPYLEKVIRCNLEKASRILRILRFHVHDLDMPPSQTHYKRWGKGPKAALRFTKTGDRSLEESYSRHFVAAKRRAAVQASQDGQIEASPQARQVEELARLLRTLEPVLQPGTYAFVSVADANALAGVEVVATIREPEGLSAILAEADATRLGLPVVFRASWITLTVQSELEAVGLTAAFSTALGAAGIPCNVVAGAFHDHLFVPVDGAEEALAVLRGLQSSAALNP